MRYRVNPEVGAEVAALGGSTLTKCFNCGNCSAVCALSQGEVAFPRKIIRYLQLGLEDRLMESTEPWLCYYCGECSKTCPREAEPGELMMATRRWLTTRYDLTGVSKRLYRSEAWEIAALAVVSLVVLAFFVVPRMFNVPFGFPIPAEALQHGVNLHLFAPKEYVHVGDLTLAALLFLFLGMNTLRMFLRVRSVEGVTAPLSLWVGKAYEILVHGVTQKRWRDCGDDKREWLKHFLLVTGYATMLLLVVVFLPWFQRENAEFHWTALFGYYGTVMLLAVTLLAFQARLRKTEQIHKHSHFTDWTFLILLFFTAVTGIALHLFRLMDLALPTYVLYVAHLMIAVPMLVVEVPFGKWQHLSFRPMAQYVAAVHDAARERQARATPAVAA